MKQLKYVLLLFFLSTTIYAQKEQQISSMDFVQIQNNNVAEAMYYYENNWKVLRTLALENDYIESYQILKSEYSDLAPFHLILVTTYKNKKQFDAREKHFRQLIDNLGKLNLLNKKTPETFRKMLFGTDAIHLN